jgi:hypothetical protein
MDWLPDEDEALADIRADECGQRLDAPADEIEPFEQQRSAIESAFKCDRSEE